MHTKLFIGLALAGLVAPCGTALAVDPAAAADVPGQGGVAGGDAALEQVVVTARKRSESLQQVPMSVVSLDADEQKKLDLDNIQDLGRAVPGLQQGDLAITSRLSLRGVNSGDNNAFEQAVGVYVDGIFRGRMNQQHIGLFDLERIEVLKGPQVALYGNSSIGGAISATTRKPSFQTGGSLGVAYESEYQNTRLAGGAPVVRQRTGG